MIDHLIFDCDGVLVDSEIIAAQVMVKLLGKYGISISIDYYLHHCTGKTFSGLKQELSQEFNTFLPDHFLEEVMETVDNKVKLELQPIRNISKVLDTCALSKAVVSNSDVYQIEHAINHVEVAHHFEGKIFSSQMVEHPKPDPGVYLLAAQQLQVNVTNCLVIEDSISGATAALRAGMKVIGFTAGSHIIEGHAEKLMDIGVRHVAETSEELTKTIDALTM